MSSFQSHSQNSLFATEHACVTYLFQKRWPWGFKCPFCRRVQSDVAPAYTVVCRYCRKQTSITAHTLMHGSKKNLIAWMRVAAQFCFHQPGVSARELQRQMELSCYQTAWSWLQKIRRGAASSESAPCSGTVLFDVLPLHISALPKMVPVEVAAALELDRNHPQSARVRLLRLDKNSAQQRAAAVSTLVARDAFLLLKSKHQTDIDHLDGAAYTLAVPTRHQLAKAVVLLQKTASWLDTLYHGAIDSGYLQSYLDEFCFRHNTASWPDRLAVLDHLLTGLIASTDNRAQPVQTAADVRL